MLFTVFKSFLQQENDDFSKRVNKPESLGLMQKALDRLGHALWEQNKRSLRWSDAIKAIDQEEPETIQWDQSQTKSLLDQDLLVTRDYGDSEEALSFTYDLLGGYVIALHLLANISKDSAQNLLGSEEFTAKVAGPRFSDRHPLHEDILRSLCALLPELIGVHAYELSPNPTVKAASFDAYFEMDTSYITAKELHKLRQLFSVPENRTILLSRSLSLLLNTHHALNVEFWSTLLNALSIQERDISWSELARDHAREFMRIVERFESGVRKQAISDVVVERLNLAATFLSWLLTTTVRPLRDAATRALYWYGRRFPDRLFACAKASLAINDPYVSERLLASSYGVAMALYALPSASTFRDSTLPRFAKLLFQLMFTPTARYATTHALRRGYAYRTIQLALVHNPKLLSEHQRKFILSPFKHPRFPKWKSLVDPNRGRYRTATPHSKWTSRNYTIGGLVHRQKHLRL